MSTVFNISLSGLMAQSNRLAVSAGNIANLHTTGLGAGGEGAYTPQQSVDVSMANGGVRSVTGPVTPASVPVFDPLHPAADGGGIVQYPNISLEREIVSQIEAVHAFKANAKVIAAQDEMLGELLDILS